MIRARFIFTGKERKDGSVLLESIPGNIKGWGKDKTAAINHLISKIEEQFRANKDWYDDAIQYHKIYENIEPSVLYDFFFSILCKLPSPEVINAIAFNCIIGGYDE